MTTTTDEMTTVAANLATAKDDEGRSGHDGGGGESRGD